MSMTPKMRLSPKARRARTPPSRMPLITASRRNRGSIIGLERPGGGRRGGGRGGRRRRGLAGGRPRAARARAGVFDEEEGGGPRVAPPPPPEKRAPARLARPKG